MKQTEARPIFWWLLGATGLAGLITILLNRGAIVQLKGIKLTDKQTPWAQALADAFKKHGLPPAWGVALGLLESSLSGAVNLSGPDGARGGSFGPTQISAKTARAFGYTDPMEDLTKDPVKAAELTARMVKDGFAQRKEKGVEKVFHYGTPSTIEQMAAVWNAGRLHTDPELAKTTREHYIPTLLGYLKRVGNIV